MSISINLYRTPPAASPEEITNLKQVLESTATEKLNLYKMTEDLAVIFHNNPDPFDDTDTFPYIMLFGAISLQMEDLPQVGGFTPTVIVQMIDAWITKNGLTSREGFEKMYDGLSAETKNHLLDIGSPTKEELFEGYVAPLVNFYAKACRENNSVFFCGE